MKQEKLMTLGVFAHANAGKTTITENLLYDTHIIDKIGRVDTGTTVTDSMKVEKERGITVRSSLVSFNAEGTKVQLIDTPRACRFFSRGGKSDKCIRWSCTCCFRC